MKHDLHALVFLTQKQSPALALAAEGEAARGRAVNTQLLLDTGADYVVVLPKRSVRVDPNFGYQKNGNPLGAGGAPSIWPARGG